MPMFAMLEPDMRSLTTALLQLVVTSVRGEPENPSKRNLGRAA